MACNLENTRLVLRTSALVICTRKVIVIRDQADHSMYFASFMLNDCSLEKDDSPVKLKTL